MATNPLLDLISDGPDAASSILTSVLGLAPAGVGIYLAGRNLSSNEALGSMRLSRKETPQRSMGRAMGVEARRAERRRDQRASRALETIKEQLKRGLSEDAEFKALLDQEGALLQVVSDTLDDPNIGLTQEQRMGAMERVRTSIANKDRAGLLAVLERSIKTILETGNADSLLRFRDRVGEFKSIGSHLSLPDFNTPKSGIAYNKIELQGQLKDRFERVRRIVGSGWHAEPVRTDDGSVYAQIWNRHPTMQNARWYDNVPLKLSGETYRAGRTFSTAYQMPRVTADITGQTRNFIDAGIDMFDDFVQQRGGYRSTVAKEWRAEYRSYGTNIERIAGDPSTPLGIHARIQARHKMNVAPLTTFGNLQADKIPEAMARMGTIKQDGKFVFDLGIGAKRLLDRRDDGTFRGVVGLHGSSLVERYSKAYGVDRIEMPITLREHQLLGRSTMFADPVMKVGGAMVGGVGYHYLNQVAQGQMSEPRALAHIRKESMGPAGDMLTGGVNRPFVVDFRKDSRLSSGARKLGQGISGQGFARHIPVQFNLFDPDKHLHAQSSMFKRIKEAHAEGKYAIFTADELRGAGLPLGQTSVGTKYIKAGPYTNYFALGIDTLAGGENYGKHQVFIRGWEVQNSHPLAKIFSMSGKINVREVSMQTIDRELTKDVSLRSAVDSYLELADPADRLALKRQMVFTTSDMTDKGSGVAVQMIEGMSRTLGVSPQEFRNAMRQPGLASQYGLVEGTGKPSSLARAAAAALELLPGRASGRGQQIGSAMVAAAFSESGGLGQEAVERAIEKTMMSRRDKDNALAALRGRVFTGTDFAVAGESSGDWGGARMGNERRYWQHFHGQLMGAGLDMDTASSVVAGVYRNKVGLAGHTRITSELLNLVRSVSGERNVIDYLKNETGIKRIGFHGLAGEMERAAGEGSLGIKSMLRSKGFEKGMILDLTDAPATVRDISREVFRQGEIHLPGGKAFDAAKGIEIKQGQGKMSLAVDSELGSLVEDLPTILQRNQADPDLLRTELQDWKSRVLKLYGRTHTQLAGGKIKGATFTRAMVYDMTDGFGLAEGAHDRGLKLINRSGGNVGWKDATAFLSELYHRRGIEDRGDLAWKAKTFFTALEEGGRGQGIASIKARNPVASAGNVWLEMQYRMFEEVSSLGGEDRFFREQVRGTEHGRRMLGEAMGNKEAWKQFYSFGDVASKMDKGQQRAFFGSFIDNLGRFTSGEGGGIYASYSYKMRSPDGKIIDVGPGVAAYLDGDGDTVASTMLKRGDSQKVTEVMRRLRFEDNFKFKAYMEQIGALTKQGLSNMASEWSMGDIADFDARLSARIEQDALKELAMNASIGKTNVQIDRLQEALLAHGADRDLTLQGSGLLGVSQEVATIKTKKLDRVTGIADEMAGALDTLMTRGDVKPLRRLLQDDLFRGTRVFEGPIASREYVPEGGARGGMARRSFHSAEINASRILDEYERVARQAISQGTNLTQTANALAGRLERDANVVLADIFARTGLEGEMLMEYRGEEHRVAEVSRALSSFKSNLAKFDRRALVPVALGLGAATMAIGALGDEGYAARPISMPGERPVGANVSMAMSQRQLMSPPQQQVSLDDMLDRPINVPTTYVDRPNAYSIRGEVRSESGLSGLSAHFAALTGGGGSLRINDTRRPITSSYVDRMLGEY